MTGTIRRRTAQVSETITEIDVNLPRLPRRTKDGLQTVLGAIMTIHQPWYDRVGTIIEECKCTECGRKWPCPTVRLIVGDWTLSAPAEDAGQQSSPDRGTDRA